MVKRKASEKKKKKREISVFREYFELIAETAVFVFFVMTFVVQAFRIPTGSMETTLLIGDFLLVNKFAYCPTAFPFEEKILPRKEIERHDIVVFKYPRQMSKDFVKRVIARAGETVEIKDKQVLINDASITEEYKIHRDDRIFNKNGVFQYDDYIRDNYGPVTVPAGHLFVMGDNRDSSLDSRYWSFLPISNLKGRPWLIYFSHEANEGGGGGIIPKPRWGRFFRLIR